MRLYVAALRCGSWIATRMLRHVIEKVEKLNPFFPADIDSAAALSMEPRRAPS